MTLNINIKMSEKNIKGCKEFESPIGHKMKN
jgi:hypothetical protein